MTLRIWTPTAQVMVPFWRLVPLRAIEVSSIHGPHAEASQWNTTQGWSLQTLHCSRAGPAGQAFPSAYQHIRVENCEIHRMYNMAFRKSCTKSLQHSFIIVQSTCDLTKTNLMDSLKVQDVFDQWKEKKCQYYHSTMSCLLTYCSKYLFFGLAEQALFKFQLLEGQITNSVTARPLWKSSFGNSLTAKAQQCLCSVSWLVYVYIYI